MQDSALTAKLAAGDMVAIEAKYHAKCILVFKRKYSAFIATSNGPINFVNNKHLMTVNFVNNKSLSVYY